MAMNIEAHLAYVNTAVSEVGQIRKCIIMSGYHSCLVVLPGLFTDRVVGVLLVLKLHACVHE